MNIAYLILMLSIMLVLIFSIKKIKKSNLKSAGKLSNVLVCAICCVVATILVRISGNSMIALFSYAAYFSATGWMLYNFMVFCKKYVASGDKLNFLNFFSALLLIGDNGFLFANVVNQQLFRVYTSNFYNSIFYQFEVKPFFWIHVAVVGFLFVQSSVFLFAGIIKSPSFYKLKYVLLLTVVFISVLLNTCYIVFKMQFDVSIFFYPFVALGFYFGAASFIPGKLISNTLNILVEKMQNGLVLFDIDGKCVYVNSQVKKTFKTSIDTIFDIKPLCEWIDKDDFSQLENYSEYFDCMVGDEKKNFKIFFNRIEDEKNHYLGSYYTIQNITEETDRIKSEHERATKDKLTGLYNRDYFCEKVEHRLRFDRFTSYYILVSDIVNFKLVNDLFGTAFGDILLKRIADELRKYTGDGDIFGRIHNDHFVLLMPKRRFKESVFIDAFQSAFGYLNNFAYSLVCHIGVYEVEDRSIPVSVMCDRAFLALSTIKSDFNTTFAYYDENLRNDVIKMQELMNELPLALKYEELVMYLQPQMTKDGCLLGAEALVRWHHHEKGVIPPGDFIQVIEKIGMISEVDMYVWEAACRKLAEWKEQGRTDLYISINISPKDFYAIDVYEYLTKLVERYGISPKNLNIEITETAIIMNLERQIKLLERLRSYGFTIEMDDFGSGYSSLNMLREISVDVLKIDMAFLQESQNNLKSRKILEKIILLAKDLGMKVVTEGVEKKEQVEFLSEFGCDIYQGFYFSKPVPVREFEEKYLGQQ